MFTTQTVRKLHNCIIGSVKEFRNNRCFGSSILTGWNSTRCVNYLTTSCGAYASLSSNRITTPGLHGVFHLYVYNPDDLLLRKDEAIAKSTAIASNLLKRSLKEQIKARDVVYTIDNISNILCTIADPCELLRHVHPSEAWRTAANTAVEDIAALISRLNIDEELYALMEKVYDESRDHLNVEESLVFKHMIESMRDQGVSLPQSEKEAYLSLQREESLLSFALSDSSKLKHLAVSPINGQKLPANTAVYSYILRNHPEEEVRRIVWEAQSQCDPNLLDKLLQLRNIRTSIARVRGFRNYAECSQRECILKKPEDVENFIIQCAYSIKDELHEDLNGLKLLKRSRGLNEGSLHPWDLDYLIGSEKDKVLVNFRISSVLAYFEQLLSELFGVTLIRDTSETLWHPLVFKFVLVKRNNIKNNGAPDDAYDMRSHHNNVGDYRACFSSGDEEIAHLYMDLFAREDKANICAQFTVRCSKLLEPSNENVGSYKGHSNLGAYQENRDRLQYVTTRKADGCLRQIPATTVVCSYPIDNTFSDISEALNGTYIDAMAAQTIFHELGHTVHALCSCTDLQHLSGNRGGVDFAEFSSHLFELYFFDGLDEICKIEGLDRASAEKARLMFQKYRSIDTARMIMMALLDLKFYCSPDEIRPSDVSALVRSICPFNAKMDGYNISELLGLPALTNFDHLIHYGGTYFCYLYSRVLAIKIWKSLEGSTRSRSSGQKLYDFFLKGSTDASLAPLIKLAGRDLNSMSDDLFL